MRSVSNAAIDPPGDTCGTDKFSIKAMLIPVGSNRLLDRPWRCSETSMFAGHRLQPVLIPELTGRAHNVGMDKFTIKDKLTRAPVQ